MEGAIPVARATSAPPNTSRAFPEGRPGAGRHRRIHSAGEVQDAAIVEAASTSRWSRTEDDPLNLGDDANISLRSDAAPSIEAPLVFVGYGLRVPEMKFDDLAGQDLKGRIAVYLAGSPSDIPGPLRAH